MTEPEQAPRGDEGAGTSLSSSAPTVPPTPLPIGLAVPAVVGGLITLYGTYWDDAWHTDRGRDDVFIAPHLLLYGGVVAVAVVAALWWRVAAGRTEWIDALRREAPLRWAAIAAIAVFVSAPVDNAWHVAFGRDAVLFSPPHLLAIAASASLILGICAGLVPTGAAEDGRGWAVPAVAGALALGSFLVPVMEYEADVPQFAAAWYLPFVGVAVVLARPVAGALLQGRWPLTTVAVVYTVARIGVVFGLAASGFSTPIVPPILAVAVVADLVAERRWSRPVQCAAVVVTVHVVYVPWLAAVPHGVPVQGQDLAVSAGVAFVAAATAGAILDKDRRRSGAARGGVSAAIVLVIVLAWARPAAAHDPGQGDLLGTAELTAEVDGVTVRLDTAIHGVDCAELGTPHLVARRAGMTRRADLARGRPCGYRGAVDLPEDGRWFVYAVFDNGSQHYETWLPVEVGSHARIAATRELYRPPTRSNQATEVAVGGLLVLAAAVILHGSLRAATTEPRPPRHQPGGRQP